MAFDRVSGYLGRHLGRVTVSGHYLPQVDGLRFVAMLAILCYHLPALEIITTNRLGQSPIATYGRYWRLGLRIWGHGSRL